MSKRDLRGDAFRAILADYMAQTGARKGPDGALVYPPGVRERLTRGELKVSSKPVPGERTVQDVKFGVIQQVLLAALVALVAVMFGLMR